MFSSDEIALIQAFTVQFNHALCEPELSEITPKSNPIPRGEIKTSNEYLQAVAAEVGCNPLNFISSPGPGTICTWFNLGISVTQAAEYLRREYPHACAKR